MLRFFLSRFFSFMFTGAWKRKQKKIKTVLDIHSSEDVIALLKHISTDTITGDELVNKLYFIYECFPPREEDMRKLSLLHEEHRNKGTIEEFACTTLYAVATDVLMTRL